MKRVMLAGALLALLVVQARATTTETPRDHQFDRWASSELRVADRLILQGNDHGARERVRNVRGGFAGQSGQRYRLFSSDAGHALEALRHGDHEAARDWIRWIVRALGSGTGMPIEYIERDLEWAERLLEARQGYRARPYLASAYYLLSRAAHPEIRRQANRIRSADELVTQGRDLTAAQLVRKVLQALEHDGGGHDPDFHNRVEWRREIEGIVDDLRDHEFSVARRNLRRLIRDIERHGYDKVRNRQYVQRLRFIGQNLRPEKKRWAISQLRKLEADLAY